MNEEFGLNFTLEEENWKNFKTKRERTHERSITIRREQCGSKRWYAKLLGNRDPLSGNCVMKDGKQHISNIGNQSITNTH